jgi:hypothetical protein
MRLTDERRWRVRRWPAAGAVALAASLGWTSDRGTDALAAQQSAPAAPAAVAPAGASAHAPAVVPGYGGPVWRRSSGSPSLDPRTGAGDGG